MNENCVISLYPLNEANRLKVEARLGASVNYICITNLLKQIGSFRLLLTMRKIRCQKLAIVFDDPSVQWMSSILKILVFFTKAKELYTLDWEQNYIKFNRLYILNDARKLIVRSFLNIAMIFRSIYIYLKLKNRPTVLPQNEISSDLQRKKILYLNANLWLGTKTGGSVGHVAGVANALSNAGHELTYVSFNKNPILHSKIKQHVFVKKFEFGLPSEFNYYYNNFYILNESKEFSDDYDFIYQRMSFLTFIGVMLSYRSKTPLILEYNGSEVWIAENWGKGIVLKNLAATLEDFCLRKACCIVTISNVLKEELIKRGIAREKIVCYPNCVDPTIFEPKRFALHEKNQIKANYQIPSDAKVIMFVGTFGMWHGVDIFAKAIVELVTSKSEWLVNNKIYFMFIGDGIKHQNVKEILTAGNANQFIRFTGLIDQHITPSYLSMADIVVSPHIRNPDGSQFFGSPTKLFEYMAMGKAIIASDLEQIGEVLKNAIRFKELDAAKLAHLTNQLALLVEPGSVLELSKAIEFLVNNIDIANFIGNNARIEALKKYTWDIHIKKILEGLKAQESCKQLDNVLNIDATE